MHVDAVSVGAIAGLEEHRLNVKELPMYWIDDFVAEELRSDVIREIDKIRLPATTRLGLRPDIRNSEGGILPSHSPSIRELERLLASLEIAPPRNGEALEGQRYSKDNFFKIHHDAFNKDKDYWQKEEASGGQRTWSVLAYLNEVDEGGETWFSELDLAITPCAGAILLWYNLLANGEVNPFSAHCGLKVMRGQKYIVNKWYRDGPIALTIGQM